jgi:thioredoxin-like negative regulator of GroEL
VKFVKMNADRARFFTPKLQIKVLPTLVMFRDGVSVDRIIGFHEVSEDDDFETWRLEKRLGKNGWVDVDVDEQQEEKREKEERENIYGEDDDW